jgi:hypothetical protein
MSESIYRKRMNSYYPEVVRSIQEFQEIIDGEYPEFDLLNASKDSALVDAYPSTMSEERIAQWEKILKISPAPTSTVDMRRSTILARIRGQGKLNTALINNIVNAFTGGSALSSFEDGVLYVEITPPPTNRQYSFEDVERELMNKTPAHIELNVTRNYYLWGEMEEQFNTWQNVKDSFDTWEDVLLYVVPKST